MPRHHPSLAITAALLAWGLAPPSLATGWSGWVREAIQADHRNPGRPRTHGARLLRNPRRGGSTARSGELAQGRLALDRLRPADPGRRRRPRVRPSSPSLATKHRGATWTTNRRGMRDRDYPIDKPKGTYRIALAGDSIGAGWGVDDDQGFEPTWERSLKPFAKVEIWNHAVPGLAPGQRWEHFRLEGWASNPDLVVFQGTPADFGWDDRKLRSLLPKGIGWDVPSYKEGLAIAHAQPGGVEESYRKALRPHREAILAGVYRTVADDCRSKGVASVWLLLPRVGKPTPPSDRARLVELARASGFHQVIDLSDAFDASIRRDLAISPDDFHPNATGHAILARRINEILRLVENPGDDRR